MEDNAIIEMFLDRNQEAIEAVSKKYGNYCSQIAKNILGDPQDTEECVNDSYLKLWNSIPPHQPKNLATFIGKITRNTAFNKYRDEHTQKRGASAITLVLEELSQCIPDPQTVESELARKEVTQTLNHFLATLPYRKRYIMIRRYWYADSISDIAKACQQSESSISMTLTRLRRKLKEYLTERSIAL